MAPLKSLALFHEICVERTFFEHEVNSEMAFLCRFHRFNQTKTFQNEICIYSGLTDTKLKFKNSNRAKWHLLHWFGTDWNRSKSNFWRPKLLSSIYLSISFHFCAHLIQFFFASFHGNDARILFAFLSMARKFSLRVCANEQAKWKRARAMMSIRLIIIDFLLIVKH